MPCFCTILSAQVSTGNYEAITTAPIDPSTDAYVPLCWGTAYFRNDGGVAVNVVAGVSTASEANTVAGQFQLMTVPAGGTMVIPFHIHPAKTFIRSAGAANTSLYMVFNY